MSIESLNSGWNLVEIWFDWSNDSEFWNEKRILERDKRSKWNNDKIESNLFAHAFHSVVHPRTWLNISSSLVRSKKPITDGDFKFTVRIRNHHFLEPAYSNKSRANFSPKSDKVEKNGWNTLKPSISTSVLFADLWPTQLIRVFIYFTSGVLSFVEEISKLTEKDIMLDALFGE